MTPISKDSGVSVRPTGYKSWFVEYRPNGGGRHVNTKRMSLGSTTLVTADMARKAAQRLLAAAKLDRDPAGQRKEKRAVPTLKVFSAKFMKDYVEEHLKPRTRATYRMHFDRLIIPNIGSMKLDEIDKTTVCKLHRQIARTGVRRARREGLANRMLVTLSSMLTFAIEEKKFFRRASIIRSGE